MNILALSTTYWPLLGGSETHSRLLLEGFTHKGHQVVLVTHKADKNSLESELINEVLILRTSKFLDSISKPNRVAWEEAFFGLLEEILDLIGEKEFDIIHTQNQAALLIGAFIKNYFQCPLVASFHETEPEKEAFGKSRSEAIISSLQVDKYIVGSQYFRNQILSFGAPSEKVSLVHYGIARLSVSQELSKEKIRESVGILPNSFILICVGRYKPRKRQIQLVEVVRQITNLIPNFHLILAGSCNSASKEYLNQVIQRASFKSIKKHITILQDISNVELLNLIVASDIGTMVSEIEGFGLAILEYMSFGLPVVARNVPGISEIVQDGVNGLLVNTDQDEELIRAIIRIERDKDLYSKLSNGALETIKRFSQDMMVEKTLAIYRELIDTN